MAPALTRAARFHCSPLLPERVCSFPDPSKKKSITSRMPGSILVVETGRSRTVHRCAGEGLSSIPRAGSASSRRASDPSRGVIWNAARCLERKPQALNRSKSKGAATATSPRCFKWPRFCVQKSLTSGLPMLAVGVAYSRWLAGVHTGLPEQLGNVHLKTRASIEPKSTVMFRIPRKTFLLQH